MQTQNFLKDDQKALIVELSETYKFPASEIVFFDGEPEPTLGYEAQAAMCDALENPLSIAMEAITPVSSDSVGFQCILTLQDGRVRSNIGIANVLENIDGKLLTQQQLEALAQSRAFRNTLKIANINLIRRHFEKKQGVETAPGNEIADEQKERIRFYASIHAFAVEAGLIFKNEDNTPNKEGYRRVLSQRYDVGTSALLSLAELRDFEAFLKALAPHKQAA